MTTPSSRPAGWYDQTGWHRVDTWCSNPERPERTDHRVSRAPWTRRKCEGLSECFSAVLRRSMPFTVFYDHSPAGRPTRAAQEAELPVGTTVAEASLSNFQRVFTTLCVTAGLGRLIRALQVLSTHQYAFVARNFWRKRTAQLPSRARCRSRAPPLKSDFVDFGMRSDP